MSKLYDPPLIYRTLSEWVEKMKTENFAQVGYSDAEWFCISKKRPDGSETGLGQKMTWKQGHVLRDVLIHRWDNPRFHFAMPEALWNGEISHFEGDKVGGFLSSWGIRGMPIYERDIFTDYAARDAELFPLIDFIRQSFEPVFIGPYALQGLRDFGVIKLVPIISPNLHLSFPDVVRTAETASKVLEHSKRRICLVSAGVSSPVLITLLYERNPDCVYFDCGSIWDAFVGIGGQRQWRADLYANSEAHLKWKEKNCGSN